MDGYLCTAYDTVNLTNISGTAITGLVCTTYIQYPPPSDAFDYTYAAQVWGFAFTTIVALYFMSHGIALVLGFIRR